MNEKSKQEAEESADKWIKWAIDHKALTYWNSFVEGYLASAKPREKRIEELEAEVKEWKDKADLWCKTANLKDHNIMINKELEEENAELKARLKEHESIGNAQFWENVWSWKAKAEQLTKANELLKQWLQTSKASGCDNINIVTDTEQFLNSEVALTECMEKNYKRAIGEGDK